MKRSFQQVSKEVSKEVSKDDTRFNKAKKAKKPKNEDLVNRIIVYPITKYYPDCVAEVNYSDLPQDRKTEKGTIMSFYNRPISKEHKQLILDFYKKQPEFDMNGCIEDFLLSQTQTKKPKYKDMFEGSCLSYIGLTYLGDNKFEVDLD